MSYHEVSEEYKKLFPKNDIKQQVVTGIDKKGLWVNIELVLNSLLNRPDWKGDITIPFRSRSYFTTSATGAEPVAVQKAVDKAAETLKPYFPTKDHRCMRTCVRMLVTSAYVGLTQLSYATTSVVPEYIKKAYGEGYVSKRTLSLHPKVYRKMRELGLLEQRKLGFKFEHHGRLTCYTISKELLFTADNGTKFRPYSEWTDKAWTKAGKVYKARMDGKGRVVLPRSRHKELYEKLDKINAGAKTCTLLLKDVEFNCKRWHNTWLAMINTGQASIEKAGKGWYRMVLKPQYCMIMGEKEGTHGRIYSPLQQMPKRFRARLRDMKGRRLVEVDIKSSHPSLLYLKEDLYVPKDMYVFKKGDVKRNIMKILLLVTLNTRADNDAHYEAALRLGLLKNKLWKYTTKKKWPEVMALVDVMYKKHEDIAKYFRTGAGMWLMHEEARIMHECILDIGGCYLCVHDSIIVDQEDVSLVNEILNFNGLYTDVEG